MTPYGNDYQKNWVQVAVGLATFAFITVVLFLVLSQPFNTITDEINERAVDMGVEDDVAPMLVMWTTVFGTVFVISFIGLILWFFLGTHREEHEEYPRRRM